MNKYSENAVAYMKKLLAGFRDIFFYCGLTKEEYADIQKEAYISNFRVWRHLHFGMFITYLILALAMYRIDGFTNITFIQLGMAAYFGLFSLLFHYVFKEDSLIAQFAIYLSMILLLSASLLISISRPESFSVTFIVLLVSLPVFMIDKPYFMAILLSSAAVISLCAISGSKQPEIFSHELVLTIFYAVCGIIINTFYNYIRVHEFILQKRERKYIDDLKDANAETEKLNSMLKLMSESTIELLGEVVEDRDRESGEHIRRVKYFSYILAKQVQQDLPEYGLDDYTVELIAVTSAMHDVGKISISDSILLKPGRLTSEEFETMKTHCEKGCAILQKMKNKWSDDYLKMSLDICLNHHEKWDGKGYPNGLKENDIPISAQIVSIADIFDALTTKRVYKEAYSYEKAFAMILSGECGAFSDKLISCFTKCFDKFKEYAAGKDAVVFSQKNFELISKSDPNSSFVIGLHDQDRNLREKIRLNEEVSVMNRLSENFCYICYVNMSLNDVIRFKADNQFATILDSFGAEMKSNERFDKLLNSIIIAEDYQAFREATDRNQAMAKLQNEGHITVDFRIRLDDGIHYCRMRITLDENNQDAVIIGISKRDEEHQLETDYLNVQYELENSRREIENNEKLADRLAVIDSLSCEYDYVCSLNKDTMEIVVYRAEEWIKDMFKNLEDIVVSPEIRNNSLKGIIHPDDFEHFKQASMHGTVMKELAVSGEYSVNYRAYKYGKLLNYQTRYTIDKNDQKRIIIGLRGTGEIKD